MRDGILVTGATGNVGREVVRSLRAAGLPVMAAERDVARVKAAFGDDVQAVRLDYLEPATFAVAEGARGLFLLRPPAIADVERTLNPFVDEARRRGVRHVVFLSVTGADQNVLVPHHAVERHLVQADGWTILRPGFFAQNLGDAYRQDIVEDDRIYVPAGDGRVAFVDVRDLGELTAQIFVTPGDHDRRGYTLTGPEAIDFTAVAATLTEAIGRRIRYEPASVAGYVRHLRARGMPWGQVAVQAVLHVGLRFGQAAHVDPTLGSLLGHRPRTLRDYVRDGERTWARATPIRSGANVTWAG